MERILFPPTVAAANAPLPRRVLAGAWAAGLDLLFPPHCASCAAPLPGGTNTALCRACAERIQWLGADRCERCGAGMGLGAGVVRECPSCHSYAPAFVHAACAVARYMEGPVRHLILSLKFGARQHLGRPLGEMLAQRIRETELAPPNTLLVPAPLTRRALRRRGFNQAEEIAVNAARRLNLPLEARLLRKIRHTQPQATLTHEQRRTNLRGAFACDPLVAARHKGRRVLLIDDVITTCGTASECARTLVAAGIGEVRAAAIARG
jgi:ComF family protein